MFKKIAAAVLICTIALTAAACSSNSSKDDANSKAKAYIAARLAEEKADGLFDQAKSADGKPILNPITPDKAAATNFLNAYMEPALSEKIVSYYLTEEKADNAIVVKSDKFFSASIRATASKDDVTFEGSQKEYKITTKDGGVYTVTKNKEDQYILADFVKK